MGTEDRTILEDSSSRADDSFQRLLLRFSEAASRGMPPPSLIELFCKATREFFRVDGSYFWRSISEEEMEGAEADGWMAEQFRGVRLKATESAVAAAAIRVRKAIFINDPDPGRFKFAAEYGARSMMAAPLIVANDVVGAAVFLHRSDPDYFNDDLAAKATILAGQLGSLLEASRLTEAANEGQRRAEILVDVANAVHAIPDPEAVAVTVAEHLRVLLRTRLVSILLRQGQEIRLHAIAADSPELAAAVRVRHEGEGLRGAADLMDRAVAANEAITVAMDPSVCALGNLVPAGVLLAAPLRTSRAEGAILVYPRREGPFSADERLVVSAVAAFGAVAIANAELCDTARGQAYRLQQLLTILSELSSTRDLDEFLKRFVLRAAEFLGYRRAFVGLLEDGEFHIRWKNDGGRSINEDIVLPEGILNQAMMKKEPFWADDARLLPGSNLSFLAEYDVRQVLVVPLLGSESQVLGMLGVLDRSDGNHITQEDVGAARALATQAAVSLEATRNLHLSEQHRQRAESLMRLALELNSKLRLPEFARSFVNHAADLTAAQSAALAIAQDSDLETIALKAPSPGIRPSKATLRQLDQALAEAMASHPQSIVAGDASHVLGGDIAEALGWSDCLLVRLTATSGELVGVLCLANRGAAPDHDGKQLLLAIAAHAAIALENARLFTRMDQANRHWMEIFDAITDYIVVHDGSENVLRVNRSLADFIGARPSELIGVNMGALLAMGEDPLHACPFCGSGRDAAGDEYVHPVLDRTYLVSTSRVHGAASEGLQTIHVLKDITDRREAERRYRELFDNIQEGVFFSTPDGRFIEVNDALIRMLGYASREDLLQADIRTQVCVSVEGYEELATQMQRNSAVRNHEENLRRQDGSVIQVLINAFAVRDSQQRILQYRGVMLDISGLKAYQSELQRERDFSGKIVNNTQSLILVVDTAGLISYANRRWYEMGYQEGQLLGQALEELVSPTRRRALSEAFEKTVAGQQIDNLELQISQGEGRGGHFSVNLSPMRDDQGQVASIVVVMSDVTDAAALQAKLMHAEKLAAVGQLVSGVAHEVNNPLTAILGFADLLMENPEMPDSGRKDLRVILQEAQRTKQIVQNLLSFARQMPPQRKPVDLNTILRRTIQLRAYDFHSRGVDVVEQLEEKLPAVTGDSHQLQQVFLNVLNNAYDAVRDTGRPARIQIRTQRYNKFVEVSFRDNGYGISFPDRIFDPFFTTKEIGKGTGLGLSICYGIVREHGGEILCQNNTDGDGATFVVRLPAVTETASIGAAAGVVLP
jgi:two-component system NtrC family sensor kinase